MEEGYARVRQTGWANEAGLLGQDMMSKLGDTVWCYPIEVTEGIKDDGSNSACPTFSPSKTYRLAWRDAASRAKTLFFFLTRVCHLYLKPRRPLLSCRLREDCTTPFCRGSPVAVQIYDPESAIRNEHTHSTDFFISESGGSTVLALFSFRCGFLGGVVINHQRFPFISTT